MTGSIGILNYIRGDVGCIVILLVVLWKTISIHMWDKENICFVKLISWMMLYIFSYSLSGLYKYGYIIPSQSTYNVVVMLVMVSQTMVAYTWFVYSEMKQHSEWLEKKRILNPILVVAVLFCIVSFVSMWTGWIFRVDEQLVYHRGPLFFIQYIIVVAYMGITSLKALQKSKMKEYYVQRGEYYSIFTFIIPPAVTTILQAITPMGVFLVGYGFTIAIVMVHMNGTQERVSQDGLTRLNNRTHMSKYLQSKMDEDNNRLFLLVLDMNSFKSINDNYGHIEGDRALKIIAKALMKVANDYKCYVSRYGGDEFIIIKEAHAYTDIDELCVGIRQKLEEQKEKEKLPYELSVSIGYAKRTENIKTIPDLIAAADEKMLEEKNRYHENHGR